MRSVCRELAGRGHTVRVVTSDLGVGAEELAPRVQLVRQFVPEIQGNCEMVAGDTPADQAANLIAALRENGALP